MIHLRRASILTNSFWYGLETVGDIVIGLAASIAVARVFGPEKLGHFVYLSFLTNVVGRLGLEGIANAARRYMSEYLARQEMGLVRSVFFTTLKLQTAVAVAVAILGVAAAWWFADPSYRMAACVLVLAVVPSLINSVPSQANMVAERFYQNIPSAALGLLAYAIAVTLTLTCNWGLVGLAATILVRRTVELVIRIVPVLAWMRSMPYRPAPQGLNRQLLAFSAQNLAIGALTLIVWDRSEVIFLKAFCNVRQLAFYSIGFSVAGYTLMAPNVIGAAVGANIMVEYARSRARSAAIAANAVRYLSLLILPLNCGLAALASPAVRIAYGPLYAAAVPVLAISVMLAIPKAFYWLPYTFHLVADRQSVILRWLTVTAVLNIGLDALLIPKYGAVGAAVANGLAQTFAVVVLFGKCRRLCPLELEYSSLVRIGCSTLAMGITALGLALVLPPVPAAILGVASGILVYLLGLRITHALSHQDLAMFDQGVAGFPATLHRYVRPVFALAAGTAQPWAVRRLPDREEEPLVALEAAHANPTAPAVERE